jgi:FtsH-binding integral membrane protein
VWWPIVIYAGWVAVAVLANLSAFLAKEGWVRGDSAAWAIAMISVATLYNLAVIRRRNLREHALVAIWAFAAIAVKQRSGSTPVFVAALVGAALLFVAVSAHAYQNRATLPGVGKPGRS